MGLLGGDSASRLRRRDNGEIGARVPVPCATTSLGLRGRATFDVVGVIDRTHYYKRDVS